MLAVYYQKPQKRLQVKAHKKYQDLSEKKPKTSICSSII